MLVCTKATTAAVSLELAAIGATGTVVGRDGDCAAAASAAATTAAATTAAVEILFLRRARHTKSVNVLELMARVHATRADCDCDCDSDIDIDECEINSKSNSKSNLSPISIVKSTVKSNYL